MLGNIASVQVCRALSYSSFIYLTTPNPNSHPPTQSPSTSADTPPTHSPPIHTPPSPLPPPSRSRWCLNSISQNPSPPEVVFVVDRSGSMATCVAPLILSLGVFLKSIPVGVYFNICSFGTSHSFPWPRSSYTAQTFAEAQQYYNSIQADFGGGTEIPLQIRATIFQPPALSEPRDNGPHGWRSPEHC